MILQTESEEVIRLLPEHHILSDRIFKKTQKNDNKKMAYEDDRPLSLRMPSYFGGHLLNIPKIPVPLFNQRRTEKRKTRLETE